jgi:hypothetical protein
MLNVCVNGGVSVYFNVGDGRQINVKQQTLIGYSFLQRAFKMTCVTAKAEYSKSLIVCRRVNDFTTEGFNSRRQGLISW